MIGYKLFRKMRDGYAPLFINARQRLKPGITYPYECHPTKGYAVRAGWHVCEKQYAPHLKVSGNRVWCMVEFEPMAIINRPESQGGQWYLGSKLTILKEV